ncbi:MAG TPA: hypothetical protein VNP98_11625 [Chthoniobacterales bacterium]|nr:hypothetical protein [Chthoniobacterales bacterium]
MSASTPSSLLQLPGGEYVSEGLADLAGERESVPAFLLAIAAQRLSAVGLPLPAKLPREPELRLYRMLRSLHGDGAHSQFNACLRRLASLCQALEKSARPVPPHS